MSKSRQQRKRKARKHTAVVQPKPRSRFFRFFLVGLLIILSVSATFTVHSLASAILTVRDVSVPKYVPVANTVSTPVSLGVDGPVRKVGRTYNFWGDVETITCFDESEAVVNQIRFEYNNSRKLLRLYQSFDGAVDPLSTPYLEYTYDFSKGNRLISATYPGGRALVYSYGVAGSLQDMMGRPIAIEDGPTSLATYAYTGDGTIAHVNHPQPGLSFVLQRDRFGRPTDHVWKKNGVDIVRIEHGYDNAGNRTFRRDGVNPASSEVYNYDQINQISSLARGPLNNDGTAVTAQSFGEAWQYDKTGNWTEYDRNGTIQNRTHDAANKIQDVVSHDRNGNMTVVPKPDESGDHLLFQHDAWNRVTKVFEEDGTTKVAEYEYNGLNYRICKRTFENGVLATTKTYFYNEKWQCIEERINNVVDTTYVWGLRYVDDLVCRDRGSERLYSIADPNWNVVAVVDATGTVQERYQYDAFGKRTVLAANATPKTATDHAWDRAFTGQVLDEETGQMNYRYRQYDTELGRFTSSDPIEYRAKDPNLYRYVFNRPTVMRDAKGLSGVIGPIGPSSPGPATTSPGDGECIVSVHCWPVFRYGAPFPWGTHCGYTLDYDGGITHLDGSGSTPGTIETNTISPNTTFGSGTSVDSSICQCLLDYRQKYEDAQIPRSNTAGNSNWIMGCMSNACGLNVNWHGNPPSYHDKPPCKHWSTQSHIGPYGTEACVRVCDEYHTCP